jgi:hypothetical protein
MKSAEIIPRKGGGGKGRTMKRVTLRYIVSSYVNITMYPPVQQLSVNKIKI